MNAISYRMLLIALLFFGVSSRVLAQNHGTEPATKPRSSLLAVGAYPADGMEQL